MPPDLSDVAPFNPRGRQGVPRPGVTLSTMRWFFLLTSLLVAASDDAPLPARGHAEPLPDAMRQAMIGVTWREGCPVGLGALALLHIPYWDRYGIRQQGQLIVDKDVAADVLTAFAALYDARFPITRMMPAHQFGGSDDRSMAADNTSAFNCRPIAGGKRFSQHSYGRAIDINTIENPYVRGKRILPPEGAMFLDRGDVRPGMIVEGGAAVAAFDAIGWKWGGRWRSVKDYQHFSENGY